MYIKIRRVKNRSKPYPSQPANGDASHNDTKCKSITSVFKLDSLNFKLLASHYLPTR